MANTTVYQIVLKALSPSIGDNITVTLYNAKTLAGQCQSDTSRKGTETLSCDNVAADRVRLRIAGLWFKTTNLLVWGIKVTQAHTMTIGLYLVSARILSSKTMRATRQCRVCGSAFFIIIKIILFLN